MRLLYKILVYLCCYTLQLKAQNSRVNPSCSYNKRTTYLYNYVKPQQKRVKQIIEEAFFVNKSKVLSIQYKNNVIDKVIIFTNDGDGECIGYCEYDNTGREINNVSPKLDAKTNTFIQWKFMSDFPCNKLHTKCKKNACGDVEEVLIYSAEDSNWLIKKYKYKYSIVNQ